MATTEQRTGFRFPWEGQTSQRRSPEAEPDVSEGSADDSHTTTVPASGPDAAEARPSMISDVDATSVTEEPAATEAPATDTTATDTTATKDAASPASDRRAAASTLAEAAELAARSGPTSRPNRLMADLVQAMRTAAESNRGLSLEQLRADAKAKIERIHAHSGDDVVALRREADEEIASIREWSKAEIARIRSETDGRVDRCKQALEADLEDHAARVEREIEQVQAQIQRFEAEMSAFFEQLGSIDDPSAFAAAAGLLPDPPDLDAVAEEAGTPAWLQPKATAERHRGSAAQSGKALSLAEAEAEAESEAAAAEPEPATSSGVGPEATAGAASEATTAAELVAEGAELETSAPVEPAASSAAELEADSTAEPAAWPDPSTTAEPEAVQPTEPVTAAPSWADSGDEPPDDLVALGEDALAARLGISGTSLEASAPEGVAPADAPTGAPTASASTRVVVVGLISVSSIASFKRHLTGIDGVRSVGVSSGPDGEFVFKVEHDPILALQDALPKVPGFALRVVSSAEGTIQVAANDPDLRS